jgi:hypothetical protein
MSGGVRQEGEALNNKIIAAMSKTIAYNTRHLLLKTCDLTVICLWAGAVLTQQPLADGANLFAPSLLAGKSIDAERALPITSFYATEGLKTPAEPGTLVRTEPATDFTLPPGNIDICLISVV